MIAFLAQAGNRNAAVLRCSGTAIPAALKAAGARTVTCVCPDHATAKLVSGKLSGVRVCEGSSGYTDLADASQSAVVLYVPVKSEASEKQASELRSALFEARRVLEAEGRLIIVASLAHAQTTLRKTQGVRPLARYDLTLSGQKSAVWVFCPQDESDSEA